MSASPSARYSYSDTFEANSLDSDAIQSLSPVSEFHHSRSVTFLDEHSEKRSSDTEFSSSSNVSDTLTYQDDSYEAEDYTDVDDDALYSDTFEDPAPTDTVTSSARVALYSRDQSFHHTQSSGSSISKQEQKYYDDSFESVTATSVDAPTFITDSHIFGAATEEIRELSAEDLAKAEAFEAKENFLNLCLRRLKFPQQYTKQTVEPRVGKKRETQRQKVFCQRMINQLRQSHEDIPSLRRRKERTKPSRVSTVPVEAYGLDSAVVDKLKLENLITKMKKLATEKVHDVKECQSCREQQNMLDEAATKKHFLEYHSHRLKSSKMDEKIDEHLTRMTSINMIGEIVKDLPRPYDCSDDLLYQYKEQILRRMRERSLNS